MLSRSQEGLDMFVEEFFQPVLVPSCVGLFPLDDKSRIRSDPMPERFIDPEEGLNVNDPDREAMPIQPREFSDPVREAKVFVR